METEREAGGFDRMPAGEKEIVAAVDPGREKCGLAIVDGAGAIIYLNIVATQDLAQEVARMRAVHPFRILALGNGTSSASARRALEERMGDLLICVTDEYRTTEEGRALYFQLHPPRGWRRLLPSGLQTPPRPIDDLAAAVLARRCLVRKKDGGR